MRKALLYIIHKTCTHLYTHLHTHSTYMFDGLCWPQWAAFSLESKGSDDDDSDEVDDEDYSN